MKSKQAIIEIPKGSHYKYELKNGVLTLDRVLSVQYPENYGFLIDTLSEDGDALDIFVLSMEPIPAHTRVDVQVLGVIEMLDNGIRDPKIVAKIVGDYLQVSKHTLHDIKGFLESYKENTRVHSMGYEKRAEEVILDAERRFTNGK